jgi:hypothetical protein
LIALKEAETFERIQHRLIEPTSLSGTNDLVFGNNLSYRESGKSSIDFRNTVTKKTFARVL